MIRVSALYPNKEEARFDFDYFTQKHLPFVHEKLKSFGLVRTEVDKGIAGVSGPPAPYIAATHLIFESIEKFQTAFAAVGEEIMADIPNYTDINPEIQISEMVD